MKSEIKDRILEYKRNEIEEIGNGTKQMSIKGLCNKFDIDTKTYYNWINKDEDFAKAIDEVNAKYNEERMNQLGALTIDSLWKMIEGFYKPETTTTNVPNKKDPSNPMIKEQKVTKKYIAPNPALIIFALTNLFPDKWKNRQEFTGNTKLTHEYSAEDIPDDVLRKVANAMQEAESKRERERRGL